MASNGTDHRPLPTELVAPIILTILGIYLTAAAIIGGLANGTALYVFFSNKHLRSPTNVFIIGLLACDFLMCTIGIPPPASSNLANRWLWGWTGCVLHGFSVYFFGLSNIYILAAISVDRYIIIAKPLQASNINYRLVGLSLFVCYFFGFFWSAVPFFGWSSYVFEGAGTSCAVSYDYNDASAFSYNIAISFNCYLIPIFVMLYSYYFVYMTIRSMSRSTAFDKKSRIAKRNMRIEKKMAKTIALMIGVYLFAWTPYALVAFWVAFGFGTLPPIASTIPAMFAKSASIWNPMIYVFTNKQFRRAFYEKIPCAGLKSKLIKREDEKEKESEESDIDDDKTKSTKQKQPPQQARHGVAPIDEASGEDAGEVTVVEDIAINAINAEHAHRRDETEMKDMSSVGASNC